MKTMPTIMLRVMRLLVEAMLTRISKWEDQHADDRDYRMRALNGGLYQASQSMREILDGEYNPMRKNEQAGTVGKPWRVEQQLTPEYVTEMFGDTQIPLRPVN